MDAAYDPAAWRDFGVALVSASAALLGLVFVVVSIHLRAVTDDPVLRRRAEIMLGLLATTFGLGGARDPGTEPRGARHRADADRAGLHNPVGAGDLPRGAFPAGRLARPPRSFFFGELSAGLIFAGGLGLLVHALGGAYLVAAGVILGVLSAMLAIWTLFVGLGLEQREG